MMREVHCRQTGVMLNYSYILKLNKDSKLSMALSGIINQYSYDGSEIENIDPDPALSMNVSQVAPDMSFGLVYSLKDKLMIGLGVNQLIQSKLNKFDEFNNLYTGPNRLIRHYHLSASYSAPINDQHSIGSICIIAFNIYQSTTIRGRSEEYFQ